MKLNDVNIKELGECAAKEKVQKNLGVGGLQEDFFFQEFQFFKSSCLFYTPVKKSFFFL